MKISKIDAAKSEIRAKVAEAIRAAVQVTLESEAVSRSSFLEPHAFETHVVYAAFRRKMKNANLWEPVLELLASDRFDELLTRAFQRRQRAATDEAQFTFPGFEHLPRRIRVSRSSIELERVTVGQLLTFAGRYEKRVKRNDAMGAELTRLAAIIREQPEELTVPEALARAAASGKAEARK
jgi:hypothetical protein